MNECVAAAQAQQPLVADVEPDAGLRRADLPPGAFDVRRDLQVEPLLAVAARERAEVDAVQGADDEARRKRIRLVAVVHLEREPDVAHDEPNPQRLGFPDGELSADVERVGDADAGRDGVAVAAAVHAELDQLVAHAEDEAAAQVGREGGEQLDVARGEPGDGGPARVHHVLIAVVHEVDGAAEHADTATRKERGERIGRAGDETRAVQGEFVVVHRGEPAGIPERRLTAAVQRGGALPHADGPRPDGKQQEQSAGVLGSVRRNGLGDQADRRTAGQEEQDRDDPSGSPTVQRAVRTVSPHRSA